MMSKRSSIPDGTFTCWSALPPELRNRVVNSLLCQGDEQMDWNTWVAQWKEDTERTAHKTVAAARQAGPEFRAAIDAAATTLCATIDNGAGGKGGAYSGLHSPVPLGLTRLPNLRRLVLDMQWDARVGYNKETGEFKDWQSCQLQLDDLPRSLCELRIACGTDHDMCAPHVVVRPLPPTFHLPHLVTLELQGVQLPASIPLLQHCTGLKRMVIEDCDVEEAGSVDLDLDQLPGLEHLHIECTPIEVDYTHLPPQLSYLALKAGEWESVRLCLPGNQQHTALKHLDFTMCSLLADLDLTFAPHLEFLSVYGCESIGELDFSCCTRLQHANLEGVTVDELDITPCAHSLLTLDVLDVHGELGGLAQLQQLRELRLLECPLGALDLRPLVSCTLLDLSGCRQTSLNQLPPALRVLKCNCSEQLSYVSVAELTSLVELECGCCQLEQLVLPAAGSGAQLKKLDCSSNLLTFLDLSGVQQLTQLDISSCAQLKQLTFPDSPSQLQHFDADCCSWLPHLDLHMPLMLDLRIGTQQQSLELSHMLSLRALTISYVSRLTVLDLTPLANPLLGRLPQLQQLRITDAPLTTIDLTPVSTSLKIFEARRCSKLVAVHGLHACVKLAALDLQGCTKLRNVTVPYTLTEGSITSGCTAVTFA